MDQTATFYSHMIFVLLITHYTKKTLFPISQVQLKEYYLSFKIFCIEGFLDEILILSHKMGEKRPSYLMETFI